MVVNVNGDITPLIFDNMVNAFNQLKEGERLDIYFCSPGGDIYTMEAIIGFLRVNADRINLYGYGDLCSAGFIIFYRAACPKALLPGTTGMIHLARITAGFVGDPTNWKEKGDTKFYQDWSRELKKDFLTFLKDLGLTDSELEKIKKGEDVFFLYKRMQQLLKNQSIDAEYD